MATTALSPGGMPLHRQIFLVLRDQITGGAYRSGDPLPSEEALGKLYGVSRITVRRAMQDLADDGFVQRRQGRGTFVTDPTRVESNTKPASIRASLEQAQTETEATVIEFEERVAPPVIGHALGLADGSSALYILRVRSRDGRPVMLTEAWLPEPHSAAVSAVALRERALYELIEASGVPLGRFVQAVSAEIADPTRAWLLKTDIGAPLLRIDRLVHDRQDVPVMRNSIFVDGRRSQILSDIPGADVDTAATGVLAHDRRPEPVRSPRLS